MDLGNNPPNKKIIFLMFKIGVNTYVVASRNYRFRINLPASFINLLIPPIISLYLITLVVSEF